MIAYIEILLRCALYMIKLNSQVVAMGDRDESDGDEG